ncbi:MAG: DNA starvation/stationary phase protection protein [Candidatus Sericytochromatia bacterium]|nr:DNA starvation/stationary phase protection protein [Candidatus Sericytochromatia bacterium]
MNEGKPRQGFSGSQANPIGCDPSALKPVIQALNEALASHFTLYHQYLKHHWLVRGPQWRELHALLADYYGQAQLYGDDLAERIVMLGGMPEFHPGRHVEMSAFPFETDPVIPVRTMLSNDRTAEMLVCQQLRRSVQTALRVHDYGTEHMLKNILRHAEQRADDLDHLLADESLEARNPVPRAA